MKQIIVEVTEPQHAALKERAIRDMRKIGAQLLYEAGLTRIAPGATAARRRKTKGAAV